MDTQDKDKEGEEDRLKNKNFKLWQSVTNLSVFLQAFLNFVKVLH